VSPKDLESIPEMAEAYPEFSQFKELPAWGVFVKNANNITFDNVKLIARDQDYRPAIVLDKVNGHKLKGVRVIEKGVKSKKQIIKHNTK